MEGEANGQEKYESYRLQMQRLNRALRAGFYFEAIVIEYAVMEDRLQSALEHAGKYNPNKHEHFKPKVRKIQELAREKKGLPRRYFSDGLLAGLLAWADKRNDVIHGLMKGVQDFGAFRDVALEGAELAKTLRNKVGSYNRMVDKLRQ